MLSIKFLKLPSLRWRVNHTPHPTLSKDRHLGRSALVSVLLGASILAVPQSSSAVMPPEATIGIPKGEVYVIVFQGKQPRCKKVFTWDNPPKVVKVICKKKKKKKVR